MEGIRILWVDDEIELLKPHLIFLKQKGFEVQTALSGYDALEMVENTQFDLVFLDENMPGLNGLEVLQRIKNVQSSLPVVMVTKSEEEHIMEEAIGSQISDYLIKPVNPNQLLLSIKKLLDTRRLVNEKTSMNYQQEFRKLGLDINDAKSFGDWTEVYKRLIFWELELEKLDDNGMDDSFNMQKKEANQLFARFIEREYPDWMQGREAPVMSHNVFAKKLFPLLADGKPTFVLLIDNLRYDQWKVLQNELEAYFRLADESMFYSILPTATQYARNSMFAGFMPSEIKRRYSQWWRDEGDEESKIQFEA